VTSGVILLADERCSTTEESIDTGGNDDTLSLTLFACGPTENIGVRKSNRTVRVKPDLRETLVGVFLGNRKRLSSERSLIDGHVDSFG
jgi:hypothetical protein